MFVPSVGYSTLGTFTATRRRRIGIMDWEWLAQAARVAWLLAALGAPVAILIMIIKGKEW